MRVLSAGKKRITMFRRYQLPQITRALLQVTRHYAGAHQKVPMIRLSLGRVNDLKEKLTTNPVPSAAEWSEIRKGILDERRFTATNVDSTVLGLCNTLESGKSYVQFLRGSAIEMNLAMVGKLLRLYRVQHSGGFELNEEDHRDILKFHNDLREANSVLDANTCEHLVAALTLTEHWRLSFELLDMIKLTGIPDSGTYSFIIAKCFQVGDIETGWKLLEEQASNKRFPNDEVFLAWIDHCLKDGKTFVSIARVLHRSVANFAFTFSRKKTSPKCYPSPTPNRYSYRSG